MSQALHPAASQHLPFFIAGPGQGDTLMTLMALLIVGSVLGVGVLFLRLHTLPERIAHKRHKVQFDIVAVLGLLALFTHIHLFWVAGLLLALIEIPSFSNPVGRMVAALEKIAGIKPPEPAPEPHSERHDNPAEKV